MEVADNGSGVAPASYEALTLKYHTSKLSAFDDLAGLATFGFRGEALSSLCAVADVSVVTRTAEQAAGVRLTYDPAGALASRAPAARAVGTTVAVRDLFKRLPVRCAGRGGWGAGGRGRGTGLRSAQRAPLSLSKAAPTRQGFHPLSPTSPPGTKSSSAT